MGSDWVHPVGLNTTSAKKSSLPSRHRDARGAFSAGLEFVVKDKYLSSSATAPGVCPMSPIFTLCHELRSRMRGGRPDCARAAANGDKRATLADRKRRQFILEL